jgi:hypothetical protein
LIGYGNGSRQKWAIVFTIPSQGRRGRVRLSAERCIRKAAPEPSPISGFVGLADATAEDEAATGTAFALMEIE